MHLPLSEGNEVMNAKVGLEHQRSGRGRGYSPFFQGQLTLSHLGEQIRGGADDAHAVFPTSVLNVDVSLKFEKTGSGTKG